MLSKSIQNPILRKWGFLLFIIGISVHAEAQKVSRKTWDANNINVFNLVSDDAFEIEILTSAEEQVKIEMEVEGEHSEEVVLATSFAKDTLQVSTAFRPYFQPENDKLAAHKVISVQLKIQLPHRLAVLLLAEKAHVFTKGDFEKLQLDLKRGNAILEDFKGNASINTWDGDITVYTKESVFGKGISKYGTVENNLPMDGSPFISAESVKGNISLLKSQE